VNGIPLVHAAWLAPLCAVAGFAIGRALPAPSAGQESKIDSESPAPAPAVDGTATSVPPGDSAALESEAAALRARLRRLKEEQESSPARARRLQAARRMLATLRVLAQGDAVPREDATIAIEDYDHALAEMDEDLAAWFLDRVAETHEPRLRRQLVAMAFRCGGPEVSAWYVRTMAAPPNDPMRIELLAHAARAFESPVEYLPFTPGWTELADSLGKSLSKEERSAALAMYSALPADDRRDRLKRFFAAETDIGLRRRTLQRISEIGDASTLRWLKEDVSAGVANMDEETRKGLQPTLESAINDLETRLRE